MYNYLRFLSGFKKAPRIAAAGFRKPVCSSPAALENLSAAPQWLCKTRFQLPSDFVADMF
jgi:hypothetical protein